MKLVHYAPGPLTELVPTKPNATEWFKPHGLWVSDDDCEDNWHQWCTSEGFNLDWLTHVHDVKLKPEANMLILRTAEDLRAFDQEWHAALPWLTSPNAHTFGIRWADVQRRYAGLIITPYIWECRLELMWYYAWDCASGCIWDTSAIASVTLRDQVRRPATP